MRQSLLVFALLALATCVGAQTEPKASTTTTTTPDTKKTDQKVTDQKTTDQKPATPPAPDYSKVQIKVTHVAEDVYMLQGSGGNIGVSVGDDGILVVDDEFAPLADKIRAALKGITDKPVKFVLNTHWHFDHTGGNPQFGETAPILAHENVRKRLKNGGVILGRVIEPMTGKGLPVITFEQGLDIHMNGEDIKAIHFANGHTDGDTVVFFPKANVVHMGDDFVRYGFPFVDLASGGSVKGMIAGDQAVLEMVPVDAKIIPGHGDLSTVDDLRKFVHMLEATRTIVRDAVDRGMTLTQIKERHLLSDYEKDWGNGMIKADGWIDVLYDDVKGERNQEFQPHN